MVQSDSYTNGQLPKNGDVETTAKEDSTVQPHCHLSSQSHPHVHDEESLRRIINRLSRIEGHVRGVKTMVQDSRPCPEVLVQIAAVRAALDRVARIILDEHLSQCISRAATDGENIETEIEELKAALDRFIR
jgi:DNA-binding FrmR family transcriptional regulator